MLQLHRPAQSHSVRRTHSIVLTQAKHAHRIGHPIDLKLQLRRRTGEIVHQCGVFLCQALDMRQRLIDLQDASTLLGGGRVNFGNQRAHLTHGTASFIVVWAPGS